jgi:hypothetical protein
MASSVASGWSRWGAWRHRGRTVVVSGADMAACAASTWASVPYSSSAPWMMRVGTWTLGSSAWMSQSRKAGSSQMRFQPQKAPSTLAPWWRSSRRLQLAALIGLARRGNAGDRHVLDEEVRRHQHQPAQTGVRLLSGIDGGDRGAIAVADEDEFFEPGGLEDRRQPAARLVVHVADGPWRGRGRGAAIAASRPGEYGAPGRGWQPLGKIAPHGDAAEALVQQHEPGLALPRPPPVFQLCPAEVEKLHLSP